MIAKNTKNDLEKELEKNVIDSSNNLDIKSLE